METLGLFLRIMIYIHKAIFRNMILSKKLEEIKEDLLESKRIGNPVNGIFTSIRYNDDIKKEILQLTTFLDDKYNEIEIGQRLYHIRDNIKEILYCRICGKPKAFYRFSDGYFSTCGNKECKNKSKVLSFKKTIYEKYDGNYFKEGSEAREKYKNTMIDLYGVDHNFKSKELRENAEKTMAERHGVKHALSSKKISEKRNQTCMDKHGTLNFIQSDKSKKTNINRYGFENPMQNQGIAQKVAISSSFTKQEALRKKLNTYDIELIKFGTIISEIKCNRCGNVYWRRSGKMNSKLRELQNPCSFCNPPSLTTSMAEDALVLYLSEIYDGEIKRNYRDIFIGNNKFSEVDAYLPKLNIAFEYNGLYWHSEKYRNSDYHQEKTLFLLNKGIKLYHIWEDDWINNNDIIKSIVSSLLNKNQNISSDLCEISIVTNEDYKKFSNENHLNGYSPSSITIGLYYLKELVLLMSFLKTSKNDDFSESKYEYEVVRNCPKIGICIDNGADKILNYFKRNYSSSVVLYLNVSFSPKVEECVYFKTDAKYIKITPPNYTWVIDGKRINKLNLTKEKLIRMGYDQDKSMNDIMHGMGYYKIWDCGNYKFSLT